MQDIQIQEIEKSILATFRSPAAAEKFSQLVAEKEKLIEKQSSGQHERLKRNLEALKQTQTNANERYAELSALATEKAEIVREIQLKLETANGDLNVTNFELATLANQISQYRAEIKNIERELKSFEPNGVNE